MACAHFLVVASYHCFHMSVGSMGLRGLLPPGISISPSLRRTTKRYSVATNYKKLVVGFWHLQATERLLSCVIALLSYLLALANGLLSGLKTLAASLLSSFETLATDFLSGLYTLPGN